MEDVYEVHTNLDPAQVTQIAVETYRQWLEFALGRRALGGRTLAHPSGRYAASITWRRTGAASIAIIADTDVAPEAASIETGSKAVDIRAKMLDGGKVAKDGHRYRRTPMREDFEPPSIATFVASSVNRAAAAGSVTPSVAKMWMSRKADQDSDRVVTMSDKATANNWIVPARPAYSPAAILARALREDYGRGAG